MEQVLRQETNQLVCGDRPMGECCEKRGYQSKQELLQQYEIRIQFLSVGCIINVGCKSIAFSSVRDAMKELNDYVENPKESSDKWNKIFNEK